VQMGVVEQSGSGWLVWRWSTCEANGDPATGDALHIAVGEPLLEARTGWQRIAKQSARYGAARKSKKEGNGRSAVAAYNCTQT
jgi:hypothetical protein